jgi:putative transposase
MARLPRLSLAEHAHLVLLRGHNGQSVFSDDVDRQGFLSALVSACASERVALHGYALLPDRVWLLCTPAANEALSRAMQSLGRRFAAAFNRRHRRSGSLWDGRYRATVVEGGETLLEAMVFVDQAGESPPSANGESGPLWSSARQHRGQESGSGPPLNDAEAYWALGNTPFDRAAAYGRILDEPLAPHQLQRISDAAQKGWALGSAAFLLQLRSLTERPLIPRARGRPKGPKRATTRREAV